MPVRPTPRRLLGATLGLALACGGSLLATSQPARAATACETLDAPVYSALHKTTKNSLLTPWAGEERGSVDYGFDPQRPISWRSRAPRVPVCSPTSAAT